MIELGKGWIIVDQNMKPVGFVNGGNSRLVVAGSSKQAWLSKYNGDAEDILTAQAQGCKSVFVTINLAEKQFSERLEKMKEKIEEAKKSNQPIGEPDESFT